MFYFGTPEDNARLLWESALSVPGPTLNEKALDEMTEAECKNALVYARIAYQMAETNESPKEVLDILLAEYDRIFEHTATISEDFKEFIRGHRHQWLGGYDPENIKKYKKLAGVD